MKIESHQYGNMLAQDVQKTYGTRWYWREIDLSNYIPQLNSTQFGIVGVASKGPINQRTLITTPTQLIKVFGPPISDHFGIYAALEYLKEGRQLWFVRVDSIITPAVTANVTATDIDGGTFTITAPDAGDYYNSVSVVINHTDARQRQLTLAGSDLPGGVLTELLTVPMVPSTFKLKVNGTTVAIDDGHGVITGTDITGTVDYLSGDVSVTFTTPPANDAVILVYYFSYTTFKLNLLRTFGNKTYTLETFQHLNLDQNSNSYYLNVLRRSILVRFPENLSVMPAVQTLTLSGGTNGLDDISVFDYLGVDDGFTKTGLQLFINPDEVDINMIAVPGVYDDVITQGLISLAEVRADCVALLDPPDNLSVQDVVDWADGAGAWSSNNAVNSSYASLHYPWIKVADPFNTEEVFIPPSGFVAACFARTDAVADVWYAPMGPNRGKVLGALEVQTPLSLGDRDYLYEHRINPINDFIAYGILIWGQKTTQVYPTALDRLNVRRLMIYTEKVLVTAMFPFVGEPNNEFLWKRVTGMIQPYLDRQVARGAFYEAKVECNNKTNTPDTIDQNQLIANVYVKPVKTAEIITLNFVILATGANIEEYMGRQY